MLFPTSLLFLGITLLITLTLITLIWGKMCRNCSSLQSLQRIPRRSIDSRLSGDLNPPTPEILRANLTNSRDSGINMMTIN